MIGRSGQSHSANSVLPAGVAPLPRVTPPALIGKDDHDVAAPSRRGSQGRWGGGGVEVVRAAAAVALPRRLRVLVVAVTCTAAVCLLLSVFGMLDRPAPAWWELAGAV